MFLVLMEHFHELMDIHFLINRNSSVNSITITFWYLNWNFYGFFRILGVFLVYSDDETIDTFLFIWKYKMVNDINYNIVMQRI